MNLEAETAYEQMSLTTALLYHGTTADWPYTLTNATHLLTSTAEQSSDVAMPHITPTTGMNTNTIITLTPRSLLVAKSK